MKPMLESAPALPETKQVHTMALIALPTFHCIAALAPLVITREGLIAFAVLSLITLQLGISMGYHRLLTHRSFSTFKICEYFLAFCGCLAAQTGPIKWVAIHRLHHKESDNERDPHTPMFTVIWGYILWVFFINPDLATHRQRVTLAADVADDQVLMFFDRHFGVINLCFALLLLSGGCLYGGWRSGLSLLIWGGFLRIVFGWHLTFLVNTVSHLSGYRNYDTPDNSRNTWWLGILAFGDGWHNNHHAQPRSAAHGHRWFELDITYYVIVSMRWLGLVWNIVGSKSIVPFDQRNRTRRRVMDFTRIQYELADEVTVIRFNRPEVHNCIDSICHAELIRAWSDFRDDERAKVAIITGAGDRAFCSGGDLKAADDLLPQTEEEINAHDRGEMPGILGPTRWTNIYKPIIAAINGLAYAGGLEWICFADIRIAEEHATFGVTCRRWNIGLADGGTQRLPRIIGLGRAMELIITGRVIDASEALKIGLIHEIVPKGHSLERAKELAEAIASLPQEAIRTDKEAVIRGYGLRLEEGLMIEAQCFNRLIRSQAMKGGIRRFVERDHPDLRRK